MDSRQDQSHMKQFVRQMRVELEELHRLLR